MEPLRLVIDDGAPVKPGMPLLLPAALAFWIACAAAYGSLSQAALDEVLPLLPWPIAAAAACGLACAVKRARPIAFIAAAVALGIGFGIMGAAEVLEGAEGAIGEQGEWTLVLEGDSSPGAFGATALAEATGPGGAHARLCAMMAEDAGLERGAVLKVRGAPRSVKDAARSFYWSQGVAAAISVDEHELEEQAAPLGWVLHARASAISALGEHGGAQAGLLQALACGYRPTLSAAGSYEDYKTCGLAHLVAVSGAHLSIVTVLLRWLLGRLRASALLANGITIAFIMAYLVFAGVPVSAVRASVMVVLAISASAAKRRSASLNALALCIVSFIALDPVVSVSASFILSVGSTLGILLFAGLIASWSSGAPRAVRDAVCAPLSMTLASNIATLPYSAALFSQVPLIAPLANVVAAPLFTLACIASLLAAIASCAVPGAAAIAIPLAGAAAQPLSAAVGLMARIPYACIAVSVPQAPMVALSIASCALLWLAWPRFTLKGIAAFAGAAAALAAALFAFAPLAAADEVVMVDVGQGDAFLVRSRGRAVLIDTGNEDALLREGLGRLGVHRLDAVVISHPDDDHCASLASLSGYVGIGAVIVSDELLACPCDHCAGLRAEAERACGRGPQGMDTGDALAVGIFTLTAIWPDAFADEGGNGDSLCLLAEADCDGDGDADWRAAFLGDAEADQAARMVEQGRLGDVDVLKVGHHGSKASLTEELAGVLDPEIALISCGAGNRYGHPSDEALACLAGTEHILRSDRSGTVALRFTEAGIAVQEEDPQHDRAPPMG